MVINPEFKIKLAMIRYHMSIVMEQFESLHQIKEELKDIFKNMDNETRLAHMKLIADDPELMIMSERMDFYDNSFNDGLI